jgi:ankyrin repeat protein
VKSILISGADVRYKNAAGWNALLFAAHVGHLEVCKFLIHSGIDIADAENDGWTAIMFAAAQVVPTLADLIIY